MHAAGTCLSALINGLNSAWHQTFRCGQRRWHTRSWPPGTTTTIGINSGYNSKKKPQTPYHGKLVFWGAMIALLAMWITVSEATLYCYSCIGTHPGCGLNSFRYRWHRSKICPRADDRCVKLIEQRGSEVLVTRGCLSHFEGHRVDIPADKYEGCRPATRDIKLGQYTFNGIKELDTKRNFYENTTWCFCMFDHRCNAAPRPLEPSTTILILTLCALLLLVVNTSQVIHHHTKLNFCH